MAPTPLPPRSPYTSPSDLEGLLERTKIELEQEFSSLEKNYQQQSNFITLPSIKKVLSPDRLRKIFRSYSWCSEINVRDIHGYLVAVVAILVCISWKDWDRFEDLFLLPKDHWGQFLRGDRFLPFLDLSFFQPEALRETFATRQWRFCPVIITQNAHRVFNDFRLLPFLNSTEESTAGFGAVFKVRIEKSQIHGTVGEDKGRTNSTAQFMARKIIARRQTGNRSYQAERVVLERFRRACIDSDQSSILTSFSTFIHSDQLNVMYPWVRLDLFYFLRGKYDEFCTTGSKIRTGDLFAQARSLTEALHFIHEDLFTDSPVTCVHMDLKPSNVLIMWSPGLLTNSEVENVSSVGYWKITEFGVCTVRDFSEPAPDTKPASQRPPFLPTPGDLFTSYSAFNLFRGSGTYQPPETQQGIGPSKASNVWSYGCIFAMVFAFALGGPQMAGKLWGHRRDNYLHYEDPDSFYVDAPSVQVKPEVLIWLDKLADDFPMQKEWIEKCVSLIKDMLAIGPDQRPSMKDVGLELESIVKITHGLKSIWSDGNVEASSDFKNEEHPHRLSVQTASLNPSTRASQDGDKTSMEISHLQLRQDVEKSLADWRRDSDITCPWTPGDASAATMIDDDEPSDYFQISKASKPFWSTFKYTRLLCPLEMGQASISPCGKSIAFCGRTSVHLYHFESLTRLSDRWTALEDKAPMIRGSDPDLEYEQFPVAEKYIWTAVDLAGPFAALSARATHGADSRYIEVYNRERSRSFTGNERSSPPKTEVPDSCWEVKLSSRGIVLCMSTDRLDLYLPDEKNSHLQIPLSGSSILRAACFSSDGDYLCAWYRTTSYQWWCIWRTARASEGIITRVGTQKLLISEESKAGLTTGSLLIPLSCGRHFLACEDFGRTFMIGAAKAKEPQLLNKGTSQNSVVAGAALPRGKGVLLVRRSQDVKSFELEVCFQRNHDGKEGMEVHSLSLFRHAFDSNTTGIAATEIAGRSCLLTVDSQGLLIRTEFETHDTWVRKPENGVDDLPPWFELLALATRKMTQDRHRLFRSLSPASSIASKYLGLKQLNRLLDLTSGQPAPAAGKVRVRWTCTCGAHLYDDYHELAEGAAQRLEAELQRQFGRNKAEPPIKTMQPAPSDPAGVSSNPEPYPRVPKASTWHTQTTSASSSRSPVDRPLSTATTLVSDHELTIDISRTDTTSDSGPAEHLHLCLERRKKAPFMKHFEVHRIKSDQELMYEIRNQRSHGQTRWLSLLSLSTVSQIDFVRFELLQKRLVNFQHRPSMPPEERSAEYRYTPCDTMPPLGPAILKHLYDYPCDADGSTICRDRFPKRLEKPLEIHPFGFESTATNVGWGLHLREGISTQGLFVYGAVMLCCSLFFAVAYFAFTHDTQGALAIAGYFLVFFSISVVLLQMFVNNRPDVNIGLG